MKKPTQDTLIALLNHLVKNPVLSQATKAVGYRSDGILWQWIAKSRAQIGLKPDDPGYDPKWLVQWPDPEGEPVLLHQAMSTARNITIADFESIIRRDVALGVPTTKRTPNGDVIFEVDYALLAEYGDGPEAKENAERLGGVIDFPYRHQVNDEGKLERIPVIEHVQSAAALRVHASRALLGHAGFNPSNITDANVRVNGGVIVMDKAAKQGNVPSYSREAKLAARAKEDTNDTPLRRDLMRRLQAIQTNGPTNPQPQGSVRVEGRPVYENGQIVADPSERAEAEPVAGPGGRSIKR